MIDEALARVLFLAAAWTANELCRVLDAAERLRARVERVRRWAR